MEREEQVSRPLRIRWHGWLYHATSREGRREAIVVGDADRSAGLSTLGETCERFSRRFPAGCRVTHHEQLPHERRRGSGLGAVAKAFQTSLQP